MKDGIVYSADYDSLIPKEYQWIPDRKFIVNAFNLKTREKTGSREYNWTLAGDPPYRWGVGNVWMSGDKLYIEQDDRIAEYDFDAYRAGAAPLRTFSRPSGENGSLPRIVQDHLIYRNSTTGELTGIRLKDGQTVSWRGDAPASQIDVYGKGVYLAQRNGTLLGLNTLTTEPVFKVKTGADLHASTLKTGDMFIIQAEGKLIGVKLPKELR